MDNNETQPGYVVFRFVTAIKCRSMEIAKGVGAQNEVHATLQQTFMDCFKHVIEGTGLECERSRMFVSVAPTDGLPAFEDIPQIGERDEGKESPT